MSADTGGESLSQLEVDILAFERGWWRGPIEKEQAIRETFGLSGPQYYQMLNALIDQREALAADPLLVKRLLRMRAQRRQARYSPPAATKAR